MKTYSPSKVVPIPGLLLGGALVIFGGVAVGVVLGFISTYIIYLVIFFPIAMGIVAGFLAKTGVRNGKIRNPLVGLLLGLLAGVTLYGAMRTTEYLIFRNDVKNEIVTQYGPQDQADIDGYIDWVLDQETGSSGFFGFLRYTAKLGVEISQTSGLGDAINLGEIGTWYYWVIEFLVILGLAQKSPRNAAAEPFCENCDTWFGKERGLGFIQGAQEPEVMNAVASGDASLLVGMFEDVSVFPMISVGVRECSNCQMSDAYVKIDLVTRNYKGKFHFKKIAEGVVNHFQMVDIRRTLAEPALAQPDSAS